MVIWDYILRKLTLTGLNYAMAIKRLEKKEWQKYFDSFSKNFLKDKQPEYAVIRVLTAYLGMQPATQWMLLKGITYDAKGDLLDIHLENFNRLIRHPSEIYVHEESNGWLSSFEVIQSDGTKDIIETR